MPAAAPLSHVHSSSLAPCAVGAGCARPAGGHARVARAGGRAREARLRRRREVREARRRDPVLRQRADRRHADAGPDAREELGRDRDRRELRAAEGLGEAQAPVSARDAVPRLRRLQARHRRHGRRAGEPVRVDAAVARGRLRDVQHERPRLRRDLRGRPPAGRRCPRPRAATASTTCSTRATRCATRSTSRASSSTRGSWRASGSPPSAAPTAAACRWRWPRSRTG